MTQNIKTFTKPIDMNKSIDFAIGTLIADYDIQACHPSMLYFIKGPELYDKLMSMPKLERNIYCGTLIGNEPGLGDKISKMTVKYFNEFCKDNGIKETNFISSTRDSIMIVNKKPVKTQYENGIVKFRSKDGEWSSYIRLKTDRGLYEIMYDGMFGRLHIKGLQDQYLQDNKPFTNLFKQLLQLLESSKTMGVPDILKKANLIRNKYIKSNDPLMWASVSEGNKFVYAVGGDRILMESITNNPDAELVKNDNYVRLMLPIIQLCFKPH